MRTVKSESLEEKDHAVSDWKDEPEQILKYVDELLKSHGLEIVTEEVVGSWVIFSIDKRKSN